jgi:hypothetical protein
VGGRAQGGQAGEQQAQDDTGRKNYGGQSHIRSSSRHRTQVQGRGWEGREQGQSRSHITSGRIASRSPRPTAPPSRSHPHSPLHPSPHRLPAQYGAPHSHLAARASCVGDPEVAVGQGQCADRQTDRLTDRQTDRGKATKNKARRRRQKGRQMTAMAANPVCRPPTVKAVHSWPAARSVALDAPSLAPCAACIHRNHTRAHVQQGEGETRKGGSVG